MRVTPSRTGSCTHTTRESDTTASLKARMALVSSDWSISSTTLPLHSVLSAAISPPAASLGRTAS